MNSPALAYILATDTYATIRPVIERLRRQTARDRVELIVAAPSTAAVQEVFALQDEFARIHVVEDPVTVLAQARAAAIRAASAPLVFVGETHSYPHPELAECLIAALSGDYTCAVPALGNANPGTAKSWAGFLSDYGRWLPGLPAGEIGPIPIYNAAFQRAALLALGDRLAPALGHGDELQIAFATAGHRACFEPAARLDHVNVAPLKNWIHERFLSGILIAHSRSRRWPLARRLFYAACSPAIPLVLISRVVPGVWATIRRQRLPWSTLPLIVAGFLVKGVGEFAGYMGLSAAQAERGMLEYEVHKLAYAGKRRV